MKKEALLSLIDRVALIFFMIMAFFIPTSNAIVEVCFGAILFCFVLKVTFQKPCWNEVKVFFGNRVNLSLLVFFVFMGLSLFASSDLFGKSLRAWTCKWGEGILLFYFAQFFLKEKQIKIVLIVFMVTAFITSLSGFWQQITGFDFLKGYEVIRAEYFTAIRSSFYHYNDFAAFIVPMFFIGYGFLMQKNTKTIKGLTGALLLMFVVNLCATQSRGGWFAFLLAILVSTIFFVKRKQRIVLPLFFLFLVAVIIVQPVAKERVLTMFKPGADSERFFLWEGAFSMFKSSPLVGKGVGLFMDRFPEYSEYTKVYGRYAHNACLQILAETGILGLVGFLWFLWELILGAYKKLKIEEAPLFRGLFLGVTAFLAHSFFDTHFYSLRISIFFWMLAGMLSVYNADKCQERVSVNP